MSDIGNVLSVCVILLSAVVLILAMKKSRNRSRRQQTVPIGTLRDVNDSDGSRHLTASLNSEGDVVIEGRDCGDGVERVFGFREYEWVWTIPATNVPALLQALEATDDVISAISGRFSGDGAADLGEFLEANGIPTERWSRIGD